jgi:hypothetical protein
MSNRILLACTAFITLTTGCFFWTEHPRHHDAVRVDVHAHDHDHDRDRAAMRTDRRA